MQLTKKTYISSRRRSVLIGMMVFGLAGFVACASSGTGTQDSVVYLVRHAEKVTGDAAGRDPALTVDGQARAETLANLLADKSITHIHSSDYIRTRDTAAPLASITGLAIDIYDPRDLPSLAEKIKNQAGRHLVVGHSNTIPETVIALGGQGGTAIDETSEYDRLYQVNLHANDTVKTELKRYGVSYKPNP